jgi:outer membrane receptor protein involved in Fe transport
MNTIKGRSAVAWLLASLAIMTLLTTPALAQTRTFNVPAQPATSGIPEFARQAGIQILVAERIVHGKTTAEVVGSYTVSAGLAKLLAGTSLIVATSDEHTITLEARPKPLASTRAIADESGRPNEADTSAASTSAKVSTDAIAGKDQGGASLSEIIVTAQKREERLIDVPISISVLTAEALEERNVVNLGDLAFSVPGLGVENSSGDIRRIFMRGVSNISGGNSALIGMYLDEADVTSTPFNQLDLRTYDLDRVEVLRGPQGTLYGEGAAGGTIRFITKKPDLSQFSLDATATVMFTEDGAPSQRIDEVINLPVIDGMLAFRVAGEFEHEGGWINQPAANRTNINSQNMSDVRIKGLWQPSADLSVNAIAIVHRNETGVDGGEDANGNYTQVFNLTTTPQATDDYDVGNLTVAYDASGFRILNTTTYLDQNWVRQDSGNPFQETPPGTPLFDFYAPNITDFNKTFTDELRLNSVGTGPWQWTVGAFYRHANIGMSYSDIYFGMPGPPGTPLPAPSPNFSDNLMQSWSIFADSSYRLADRLTLGVGARYFKDNQEYTSGPPAATQTARFNSTDPRVYLDYKVTEEANIYVSAAKGFRSGGFNSYPPDAPTFGPEDVWTYELGTKLFALDRQISINADIFYSNYTNYQTQGIPPAPAAPLDITTNGGSAKIKGVEWGFDWHPVDEWTFSFSGDYVDSYFYKINALAFSPGVPSANYNVGDSLDYFPKYMYTASLQRNFRLAGRAAYARLDYDQQGRSTDRMRSIGPWYLSESDVIHTVNLNTNLVWSESLSLGVFAQNLLNDRGFVNAGDYPQDAARAQPLTVGFRFNVSFH